MELKLNHYHNINCSGHSFQKPIKMATKKGHGRSGASPRLEGSRRRSTWRETVAAQCHPSKKTPKMVSQPCPGGLAGPRPVACSHPRLGCPGRVWMAPGWEALWVSPTPCVGTLRTACDGHVHWGRAGVCVTFCGHSTCFYFLSIMKMRMGLITYLVFRAKFASLHISPGIVVAFGCYYILRSLGVRDFSTCSFSE